MATAAPSTTSVVAHELVSLCRQGRNMEVLEKYYSPDIESVEAVGDENLPQIMRGIDAIRGKNEWWFNTFSVNSADVSGPFVGDDQFAVHFSFDTTNKQTGERTQMTEMALYTVRDGKIVREQFFYNVPGK
jgi:ketosteroid isomerase-like protein